MRSTVVAGCLALMAALAGCHGDAGPSSSEEPARGAKTQGVTLSTSSAGLVKTTTPKGAMVRLEGRFESAAVARRNADGSITTECHDDQQQAEAFFAASPASAATPEVR